MCAAASSGHSDARFVTGMPHRTGWTRVYGTVTTGFTLF